MKEWGIVMPNVVEIYSKNFWQLIHLLDEREFGNGIEIPKQEWRSCSREQCREFGNRTKIPKQEWRSCSRYQCWIKNDENFEHAILIEEN